MRNNDRIIDIVIKASRKRIEYIVESRLKLHLENKRWTDPENRYLVDTLTRIDNDYAAEKIDDVALKDYIATSSPLHVIDGWAFLGRAVDSLMRGDADSARHLAYYAELRAAMSLMASEGIGIFNDKHFVVSEDGQLECIKIKNMRTHNIAWAFLESWSGLEKASSLLNGIICPYNVGLIDWLNAANLGTAKNALAQIWLQQWGLDISQMKQDRNARNEASYRPTQFRKTSRPSITKLILFVEKLWRLFEPGNGGKFPLLDQFLFRLGIEKAYSGKQPKARTKTKSSIFENMLSYYIEDQTLRNWINQFLLRYEQHEDPLPLQEAAKKDPIDHERHHLQVISRAALLLRVATGSARLLLMNAGIKTNSLTFWSAPFGKNRALWEQNPTETGNTNDIWTDIEEPLDGIAEWLQHSCSQQAMSLRSWRMDGSQMPAIVELGGCELIGMWGMLG